MAHRGRSKTVDSVDSKKSKGATPRRLTEKIAIIKKREHEQSEAFEQAMQSIFEMQQARIHSGGGSMPSLQAIDSTPPAPSIDMQSIFKDFNEMRRGSGVIHERPQSAGRRVPMARTSSMETDPYPAVGLSTSDHYWNASPEWIEGDLSRHKSDSDLQQSLLLQQQTSPQHLGSPQAQPRNHKLNTPTDLSLWGNKMKPNSITTHALLSPDQYIGSPDGSPPLGGSVGTASSLPDLTNIEFHSGLDVPLERDEPIQDPQQYNTSMQSPIPSILLSPTNKAAPGPSKLIFNSIHASPPGFNSGNVGFTPYHHNTSPPAPGTMGVKQPSPLTLQAPPPVGGISRSPTMPEFRNLSSSNGFVPRLYRPPLPQQYKPILPNNQMRHFHHLPPGLPHFLPHVGVLQGQVPVPSVGPPPMTIIIQPPPLTSSAPSNAQRVQQPVSSQFQPDFTRNQPHPHQILTNSRGPLQSQSYDSPGPDVIRSPTLQSEKSVLNTSSFVTGSPHKSVDNVGLNLTTGAIPISGAPMLPSYAQAKLQQSLQEKFATINVGKNEGLIRSHSEENLQKIQKERNEVIQHNPFMGTLGNANSVPCVYVEASNNDQSNDRSDSPTTIDSPSTSASYASSPPSVRPFWIENDNSLDNYVFKEWPIDNSENLNGTGKPGSPLAHHRSLTDLSTIPEVTELVSSNRAHQLSLPSVAMTDLTVDEQFDKVNSPSDYYLPSGADFDMEENVIDSLLKNEVPELHPFDVPMLMAEANSLVSEVLLSASPDPFLRAEFNN